MKNTVLPLVLPLALAGCVVVPAQPAHVWPRVYPPPPAVVYPSPPPPPLLVVPPRPYVNPPPVLIIPGRPYRGPGYWSPRTYRY